MVGPGSKTDAASRKRAALQEDSMKNQKRAGDPTNTASLARENKYSRDELDRIFAESGKVLGLPEDMRVAFGSPHRLMALARTALVVAGARAEAAVASGTLPGTAWASAQDLHHLVFTAGNPVEKREEQAAPRQVVQPPRHEPSPTLGDALSPETKAKLAAAVAPPAPAVAEPAARAPKGNGKGGKGNGAQPVAVAAN